MTDPILNVSREFSQKLAQSLLERIELGARQEQLDLPSTQPSAVWGWGRLLALPSQISSAVRTAQIGTFGTCDVLRTIDRIQSVSKVYHRASRVAPSARLQDICSAARQPLRETCGNFVEVINADLGVAVSAARYANLLATVSRSATYDDALPARALRALSRIGTPLSADRPETIGWRWFLDKGWDVFPARSGPTALILDALVSAERFFRMAGGSALADSVTLIDSSADYLCSLFESGYPAGVEELVICMSALSAYGERPITTSETIRRRAAVVGARQLILVEDIFRALVSRAGLPVLSLKCPDQPAFTDPIQQARAKDATFDIFLHGPLISAFLISPNPTHRELARIALRRALDALVVALDRKEPISTHWLGAIIDALPIALDVVLQPDQPYVEHHRFVTVPENRMTFLIISDTQFGRDSTAHRHPLSPSADSFKEVQPATFEQLVAAAASSLRANATAPSEWSGLLHLGDVVCRGDYAEQEAGAISALRSSAEVLRVSSANIVVSPGNHDLVRSGLISDLRSILRPPGPDSTVDPAKLELLVVASLRRHSFQQILPQSGFASFREMYSHIIERQIRVSIGGVEIVSFLAPRIRIHVVSLWPAVRHRIGGQLGGPQERNAQYGLDLRAHHDVREFLKFAQPDDIVILLSHVPAEHLRSWSDKDADRDEWIGPPVAEDMASFLDYVLYEPSGGLNQPAIHLILSGHIQEHPLLELFHETWTYTAGAFHLHSGISKGTYAARLAIDEGAIRIDSVALDGHGQPPDAPTIIAIGNTPISAATYHAHVLGTYDAEAQQFIDATNVPGKYRDLEAVRGRFTALLEDRFGQERIGILDIGAGAGRDSDFFLGKDFDVLAIEGAPRLAAALRERQTAADRLSVHETNILNRNDITAALMGQAFHGIWMCATLLHVPSVRDLAGDGPREVLVDSELIGLLATHLVPGGLLYLDNKLGTGAHFKERGNVFQKRWFKYRQPEELGHLAEEAKLNRIDSNWYNGTNGFDAWTWILAETPREAPIGPEEKGLPE